ncbi:5'-3' exonuclease domain-containing protein [Heterostelium album PN500]|uniref:5'-3' exonuclease domain-containing protein n=1 Tax=Heterostelium pallidum (strain ATCC 26659 / Pp 5 / PN500) TaxID=670386 RepID=D3B705_HETP5|nr:5'-3' exonuclease domain-containing protein [Heterostelium album PN500]EFA82548.1 5'-3' exonuclease domain-containing protein [Heterostelium album PN500]|eukprot:XP_020434665.1 5'-3' exonuclease domain-containing protein [Heterostelium album PN500]
MSSNKEKRKIESETDDKSSDNNNVKKKKKSDSDGKLDRKKEKKEKKEKKVKKEKKDKKDNNRKDKNDDDDSKDQKETVRNGNEERQEVIAVDSINNNDNNNNNNLDIVNLIEKKPWLNLIKDFKKIIWSNDEDVPNIVVIRCVEECCKFISILSSIYCQEQGINPDDVKKSVIAFGKKNKQLLEQVPSKCVIGFDIEGSDMPYCVQLSTLSVSGVIYIKEIGTLPEPLVTLLESTAISKAGVGVTSDFDSLIKFHPSLKPKGALDVSCVAGFNGITKNYLSLNILATDLLGTKKYKKLAAPLEQRIQNDEFCKYAAIDAWLGIKIAHVLYQHLKNELAFYEWSHSQLTGNYRIPKQSDSKDKQPGTTGNIYDKNNTPTRIPKFENTKDYKKDYDSSKPKGQRFTNNIFYAEPTPKTQEDQRKKESAENHFYLQKLQHIKEGQKRPFI